MQSLMEHSTCECGGGGDDGDNGVVMTGVEREGGKGSRAYVTCKCCGRTRE